MHIHILGICGTFMGSLALLARELGYKVTGCDHNVYPPMSTQLADAGIELLEGFSADQCELHADVFVVGNVVSRGNPLMESILDRGLPYTSGPQWLKEHVLQKRWVLAVAGTHGKTTTSSMLAWILEFAGYQPGFLIGGVPGNFPQSARLGESDFFVIEADEYDTAFFDKRSKFIHYLPRTLIINNLEYDHADIFADLAAIQKQFHHLLRIVPQQGLVLFPHSNSAVDDVLKKGCWSESQSLGQEWQVQGGPHSWNFLFKGEQLGSLEWLLSGEHNAMNALAALAAARHVGVEPRIALDALAQFKGVKRRMELLAEGSGIKVYDDFAHHPTAISTTLAGLRASVGEEKIVAIIELRSNTMEAGVHKHTLLQSAADADEVLWFQADNSTWSMQDMIDQAGVEHSCFSSTERLLELLQKQGYFQAEHIVIMSNGGFEGLHRRLLEQLQSEAIS